jgi:hypothetical protein
MTSLATFIFDRQPYIDGVEISLSSAVDLRPHLTQDVPLSAYGTYVCGTETRHVAHTYTVPVSLGELWDRGRAIRQELADGLRFAYQSIGLLAWVSGPWSKLMRSLGSRRPNGRTHSIGISNMGNMSFSKQYGSVSVDSLAFLQFKPLDGPAISITTMTAVGVSTFFFSIPVTTMSKADAQAYVEECERLLCTMLFHPV